MDSKTSKRSNGSGLRLDAYSVIAFDMDSTLVDIECIDAIADVAGRGDEVRALTSTAMSGDGGGFATGLRRRVALLEGVPEVALDDIYESKMRVTAGAPELIEAARAAGLVTILVTGGFGYFARRLKRQLGLDAVRCNELEIRSGRLTGRLLDSDARPICDGEAKLLAVQRACHRLGVDESRAIAVGDGANDIPLLSAVGLGVAFHAKPAVRHIADIVIDDGGLDRLLYMFDDVVPDTTKQRC